MRIKPIKDLLIVKNGLFAEKEHTYYTESFTVVSKSLKKSFLEDIGRDEEPENIELTFIVRFLPKKKPKENKQ